MVWLMVEPVTFQVERYTGLRLPLPTQYTGVFWANTLRKAVPMPSVSPFQMSRMYWELPERERTSSPEAAFIGQAPQALMRFGALFFQGIYQKVGLPHLVCRSLMRLAPAIGEDVKAALKMIAFIGQLSAELI